MSSLPAVFRTQWRQSEIEAARPPENILRSEWCYRNISLTERSAIQGPYDIGITPYWRWPMDVLFSQPGLEILVICASAQIGKSFFTYGLQLHAAKEERKSSLLVLADQRTAERVNEHRLQRLIRRSEGLAYLEQKFTQQELNFINGAGIAIAWASSVAGLATFEFPIVILDETDKSGYDAKSVEADAIALAIERTETFPDRKIVLISTPSIEKGNIWTHLCGSDVIYDYHIPCPFCGQFQPLRWDLEHAYGFRDGVYRAIDGSMKRIGQVKWEGGRKATKSQLAKAGYQCGECSEIFRTSEKNAAVDIGQWVPRWEIDFEAKKVGLHLWRAYSKLGNSGDFGKLAGDWVTAVNTRDAKKIQGVINSGFAGPFSVQTQERKESSILALRDGRPRGLVPSEGVLGITAGVDTQDNGFYYVVRAWGELDESWLVREGFVDDFDGMLQIVLGRFSDVEGKEHVVNLGFQDAMGHRTAEVYEKLRKIPQMRPTKGEQNMAMPHSVTRVDTYPGTKIPIPGGLTLFRINATYYKDKLFGKLAIAPGDPGAFHVHGEIPEDYASQMVAEYRDEKGFWVCPEGRANHYWDCYDDKTEVLTDKGWRAFRDLDRSELVATVNLDSDLIEYQKPVRYIEKSYVGEMVSIKGRRVDILVTPTHRMVTYRKKSIKNKWVFDTHPEITLAKNLDIWHRLKVVANWNGNPPKPVIIDPCFRSNDSFMLEPERVIDPFDWAEFLGWYVSEGCKFKIRGTYKVVLSQNKGPKQDEIIALLNRLPWNWRLIQDRQILIQSKQLFEALDEIGIGSHNKRVPKWVKDSSPEIIDTFLKSAIHGDGYIDGTGFREYYTTSRLLADDMQELFLKAGNSGNIRTVPAKPYNIRNRSSNNTVDQYHVSECKARAINLRDSRNRSLVGAQPYNGMVYCLTVPNGTLVCRRNGKAFIAGNCEVLALAAADLLGIRHWRKPLRAANGGAEGSMKPQAARSNYAQKMLGSYY